MQLHSAPSPTICFIFILKIKGYSILFYSVFEYSNIDVMCSYFVSGGVPVCFLVCICYSSLL